MKYADTVAIKALMETEGEKERKRIRRKYGNHRFTIRFHADGWGNDRTNRKCTTSERDVLENAKKDTELTTLVLVIYADRLLLVVVFIMIIVVMILSKNAAGTM